MTPEFINLLDTNTNAQFDVGNVRLGTFMEHVLKRDKGIGGFEQVCQSRATNIGNINQFLNKDSETSKYSFKQEKFLDAVTAYYFDGSGIDYSKVSTVKSYRDLFLKGRKEGPNGSQKNYYLEFESGQTKNGDIPTDSRSTLFHCLANLIMLLYDLISMDIIMSRDGTVPENIPEKMSPEELSSIKSVFIFNLINKQHIDIMFITECVQGVFADFESHLDISYQIEYGPSDGELCNVIIYKRETTGAFYTRKVTSEHYQNTYEFKEHPLYLSSQDGNFNIICYHANGKGVTVKKPLAETSFYNWINNMNGTVIVGGDLNMDFKKCGAEFEGLLDIGSISKGIFSCYKQRSPLQAQYDKAGIFDKKFCDYIITQGFNRASVKVIRSNLNGDVLQLNSSDCTLSPNELVIPNNNFPFEHYIVMDTLEPINNGCSFFTRNIPALSWIDDWVNWAFGY